MYNLLFPLAPYLGKTCYSLETLVPVSCFLMSNPFPDKTPLLRVKPARLFMKLLEFLEKHRLCQIKSIYDSEITNKKIEKRDSKFVTINLNAKILLKPWRYPCYHRCCERIQEIGPKVWEHLQIHVCDYAKSVVSTLYCIVWQLANIWTLGSWRRVDTTFHPV